MYVTWFTNMSDDTVSTVTLTATPDLVAGAAASSALIQRIHICTNHICTFRICTIHIPTFHICTVFFICTVIIYTFKIESESNYNNNDTS